MLYKYLKSDKYIAVYKYIYAIVWLRCFSLPWILSQKPEAVKNFCPDLTKNQVTRKSRIADHVSIADQSRIADHVCRVP